jgi:hypothetical protein
MRSRDIESLSCTLSLFCVMLAAEARRGGFERTTNEAEGAMIAVCLRGC